MKRIWALVAIVGLFAIGKFAFSYFYIDVNQRSVIEKELRFPTAPIVPLAPRIELPESSPAAPDALAVQQAFKNLGIPAGVIDGKWGQRTRQGFCIWRELTGRIADRNFPIEIEQRAIVNTKRLLVPNDFVLGLNVSKTCQSAVWVKDEAKSDLRIMIASTGKPGLETDTGNFKVGWRVNRWYESIAYPDGWMYRPMFFNRGQAVHGSEFDSMVLWYPASHGCVRMLGRDIDALWAEGFGIKSQVHVYGTWNPNVI